MQERLTCSTQRNLSLAYQNKMLEETHAVCCRNSISVRKKDIESTNLQRLTADNLSRCYWCLVYYFDKTSKNYNVLKWLVISILLAWRSISKLLVAFMEKKSILESTLLSLPGHYQNMWNCPDYGVVQRHLRLKYIKSNSTTNCVRFN